MKKNNCIIFSCVFTTIILLLFFKMETDNFYIHLPSNVQPTSPLEIGNTISNFLTRLNQKLILSEDWEVGLTDISYTKSWYNIMKNQNLKLVDKDKNVIDLEEQLPAGNYENVEVIVESINKLYNNFFDKNINQDFIYPPSLIYNKQSNKIKIRLGAKINQENNYLIPKFSNFLAQLLGLTDSQNKQYSDFDNITPIQIFESKNKFKYFVNSSYSSNLNKNESKDLNTVIPPISTQLPDVKKPELTTNSEINSTENTNSKYQKLPPTDNIRINKPANLPTWMLSDQADNNEQIEIDIKTTKNNSNFETNLYVEGFKEVTLHGSIRSLYVYCSIIKPVLVGNYEAPLIRRVEIPNNKNFGDTIEINYPQPQYYPLVSYEFDNIEIDIKDDTDESLDFAFGRTAVTLHFRKKPNNVYKRIYSLLR